MTPLDSPTRARLQTYLDSGPPENSTDYTTIVVVHGYIFHGGNFKKLLPLAHERGARIVAVNRRGYPGSTPFTRDEIATFTSLGTAFEPGSPEGVAGTVQEMRSRARELYDYLVDLIRAEHVPRTQGKKGGLVLVGWSFGVTLITALLANVANFSSAEDVRLVEYMRRVVFYEGSYICFGYTIPENTNLYNPRTDPSLTQEKRIEVFNEYMSGYFVHGELSESGIAALESRTVQTSPPPSACAMTAEELAESTCAAMDGSADCDMLLLRACMRHGTYTLLREGAFYLLQELEGSRTGGSVEGDWRAVELRFAWGDRSVWEMPLGPWMLSRELDVAKKAGKRVREVVYVRIRGGNHFVHWDSPDKALRAFLGEDTDIV